MRYLLILVGLCLLTGCVEPDPMRAAIANERTIQATNSQAATAAQISQAQVVQDDARRSQELLQALQAQQAIVAGQAAQAQAESQTAIVASNNEALVLVADRIAEASKTDYKPLYAGMTALVVIVVVWLLVNARRPIQPVTPSPMPPRVIYQSNRACAWLRPDGTIILRRLSDGCERAYVPGDEFYQRLLRGAG